jgi:hypothetical protein
MPLLSSLSREQVVANLRKISHSTQKFKPEYEGVYPHQALPDMFEARLYDAVAPDAPKGPYKVSNGPGSTSMGTLDKSRLLSVLEFDKLRTETVGLARL